MKWYYQGNCEFPNHAVSSQRIVSLVPSQTELLFDLGLEQRLVGRTRFCIHPADRVKGIPVAGGTKNIEPERVLALKPDLVIANKEENEKVLVEALQYQVPVYVSDIHDLPAALNMICDVGVLTGMDENSKKINHQILQEFLKLESGLKGNALYLIWKEPWMTVGAGTFISDMLNRAGWHNLGSHFGERYPVIGNPNEVEPEIVFLSSEPYPFKERHKEEIRRIWPKSEVRLVDGEMFSWYGSRLLKSPLYFRQLQNFY